MARKKQEDPPKGSPAWMSTFSDLMNLLLCFFVLLFSMSSVDSEKMQQVIQSFQNSISILPSGGSSAAVSTGSLISSGVSALQQFDVYFNSSTGKTGDEKNTSNGSDTDASNSGSSDQSTGTSDADNTAGSSKSGTANQNDKSGSSDEGGSTDATDSSDATAQYEKQELAESEKMSEDIENQATTAGIQSQVEEDFNGQYVTITLSGSLLFDSGKATFRDDAKPLLTKIGAILNTYSSNLIEVEGHTDNVPIHSAAFSDNNVLSMFRAYYVAQYLRSQSTVDPSHIYSSGRGEYDPVTSNDTAEGRARNRRVEIKIYNSYNSGSIQQ